MHHKFRLRVTGHSEALKPKRTWNR